MGPRASHLRRPREPREHSGTIAISIPAQASPAEADLPAPSTRARAAAVASYLGAGLLSFVPPLVVYAISRQKKSPYVTVHAAQAFNAAITTALYAICSAIAGALLTLDSLHLGIQVAITCGLFAWLVTLGYLIGAAIAAARGRHYHIPAYLCAELLWPQSPPGPLCAPPQGTPRTLARRSASRSGP